MSTKLGQIVKRTIREVWKYEDRDFTPWLADEKNISTLADSIGIELQVEGVEISVGSFSADILAKDSEGRSVIIENQFGKTNHDHLGKVLTYAAALDASAVIWIAEQFTDQHRKAIEWLNDNSTNELGFYAVEVELWQIDESRPALRFNVLSAPNEIVRRASEAKSAGANSGARKQQLEFWTLFREKLIEKKIVPSAQTPRPQYWFDVPLGRSNIYLSNFANTLDGRIGVRVYLGNKIADLALTQLDADREAIEKEIGEPLQWNPNPDARDKVIVLSKDADLSKRSEWPEYIDWLAERVRLFLKTFGPRVEKLRLT
jgi:hypothetical protein